MKKSVCVILAVMMFCVITGFTRTSYLNEAQAASTAMRNLLTEFENAVKAKDLEKANSLLKEGLNVQDAVKSTCTAINRYVSKGSLNEADENFYISLMNTLIETYKGNFERYAITNHLHSVSDNFLQALLDAGLGFQYNPRSETFDSLTYKKHIDKDDKDLKRFQMLLSRKDVKGSPYIDVDEFNQPHIYDDDTDLLAYIFLKARGLDKLENLTQENLDSMKSVFGVLNYSFFGVEGFAKSYLKGLRTKYRNMPDALKYLDEIKETLPSLFSFSGFISYIESKIPFEGKWFWWGFGIILLCGGKGWSLLGIIVLLIPLFK